MIMINGINNTNIIYISTNIVTNIVNYSNSTWSDPKVTVAIISSSLTILALVYAIYKDWLVTLLFQPKFKVTLKLDVPDCVKINRNPYAYYYFRLFVENTGRKRAENVQLFMWKIQKKDNKTGSYLPVPLFLPTSLVWTHINKGIIDGILPKTGRHCDLGCIQDGRPLLQDTTGGIIGVDKTSDYKDCKFILKLDVENTGYEILEPGDYIFEIEIAASNCKPKIHKIPLIITGKWYDNPEEMFSKGIYQPGAIKNGSEGEPRENDSGEIKSKSILKTYVPNTSQPHSEGFLMRREM